MNKKGILFFLAFACFVIILPINSAQATQFVAFGTATEGGLYYIWGGGWAKVMNKALPDIEITAESTGGSTANAPLLERGRLQLGIVLGQVAYDMVVEKKMKDLRTLFPAYPGYFYVYALKKSGLRTVQDINGKEIAYVKPMHDTAVKMFEVLGIKPSKTHILTHAAVIEALQDGTVDCSMVYGPEKWPGLTSLEATHEVVFLTMTEKEIQALLKILPAHRKGAVPKGAYKATADKPYETMVDWNLILANKNLSEDIAYRLVKATYENNAALVAVHPVSSMTKLENIMNTPIPFHRGTIKYLREMKIQIPENLMPKD
jgi:TRAP transporter TAXI family solute receptor